MNIRCIALDLDRTTLNRDGRLSKGNRDALMSAAEKGIEVVPTSGRSFASLPREIVELSGLHYAITSNGSVVSSLPDGKIIRALCMTRDSVELLHAIVKDTAAAEVVFVGGTAYAPTWYLDHLEDYGVTGYGLIYVRSVCHPVKDWEEFLYQHMGELDSYDVHHHDPAEREVLFGQLRSLPNLYFTSSAPHMLEISHRDTGKGRGLTWLLNYLGIPKEECAAFGDGENDVDLLRASGWGIAVENAVPSCKAAARFITKHHDEDGVAYALQELLHVI